MKCLCLLALVLISEGSVAQGSPRFSMARVVVAGGAETSISGSRFHLASTIGQPLAGGSNGQRFSVYDGFWVPLGPTILGPRRLANGFIFSFWTDLGNTYRIQYTDSISTLNWLDFAVLTGDGLYKTVTNSNPTGSERFYRLIEQ